MLTSRSLTAYAWIYLSLLFDLSDKQSLDMESSLTISGVAIAAIYIVFRAILHFTQDAKEPLAIGTIIPFISPVLGMLAHKSKFYVRMR